MRSWTHFSTRICYFAVKWFGTSEAKIVERLSHNKATVGTEKQRLECWRLKKLLYEDLNDLIYVYVYVYVYYFQKATASAESVDTSLAALK